MGKPLSLTNGLQRTYPVLKNMRWFTCSCLSGDFCHSRTRHYLKLGREDCDEPQSGTEYSSLCYKCDTYRWPVGRTRRRHPGSRDADTSATHCLEFRRNGTNSVL